MNRYLYFSFLFFNDTATTEIYTLSLHDSLPIWLEPEPPGEVGGDPHDRPGDGDGARRQGAGQLVAVEDGRGGDVERAPGVADDGQPVRLGHVPRVHRLEHQLRVARDERQSPGPEHGTGDQ